MVEKLTATQTKTALTKLSGWKKQARRNAIVKEFVFNDFKSAFAWMTHIAIKAESMDHHPEWENIYKTVRVVLTTHDVGGLSTRDIELAKYMNKTAGAAGRKHT